MAKGGFRGMPGGGGMNQAAMLKQAQKMQQEMSVAYAGGNGKQDLQRNCWWWHGNSYGQRQT